MRGYYVRRLVVDDHHMDNAKMRKQRSFHDGIYPNARGGRYPAPNFDRFRTQKQREGKLSKIIPRTPPLKSGLTIRLIPRRGDAVLLGCGKWNAERERAVFASTDSRSHFASPSFTLFPPAREKVCWEKCRR